jgi:hypothetical protein
VIKQDFVHKRNNNLSLFLLDSANLRLNIHPIPSRTQSVAPWLKSQFHCREWYEWSLELQVLESVKKKVLVAVVVAAVVVVAVSAAVVGTVPSSCNVTIVTIIQCLLTASGRSKQRKPFSLKT